MTRRFMLLMTTILILVCQVTLAGEPTSPLFQARLEATLRDWERGAQPELIDEQEPTWWPASVNPVSYCAGSLCLGSFCLGSACLASYCVGSGCTASLCLGSGCLCSGCGGSACLGVTLCIKHCRDDTPANMIDQNVGTTTFNYMCPER